MIIAFDIHGVIDYDPDGIRSLAEKYRKEGHQIYILSGAHASPKIMNYLYKFGFKMNIQFSKYLSIADFHKEIGTPIKYDDQNRPHMDDKTWNCTKAEICAINNIDVLLDDSLIYGKYFDDRCEYVLYDRKDPEKSLLRLKNIVDAHDTKEPYIQYEKIIPIVKWNPKYNQDALCECEHPYKSHFNDFDNMLPNGCTFCVCNTFKLKEV